MRRFELIKGTSSRFWEIEVIGSGFTVRYGRIGTKGQEQKKSAGSAEGARVEAERLVAEKVGKGYIEKPGGAAAPKLAGAPSKDDATLIERLDRWMNEHRRDYVRELAKGASAKDIAKLEKSVGHPLPDALKALLMWRGEGRGRLQGNFALMSVGEIAGGRDVLNGLLEGGEFDAPAWWRKDWVPFLANGGGDHLCVDLGGAFGGVPGQVLEFRHDDEARKILYPSVDAWLSVFVETLEAGAWDVEDGGFFTADPKAIDKVRARVCPGYPKAHSAEEESGPKKAASRAKSKAAGEIRGQMTEQAAQRLLASWCKRRGLSSVKEALRPREKGFQAIARGEELLFDPDRKALFVIRDAGPAVEEKFQHAVWKELLDKERDRLAAAQPLATIEVRRSRFREEVDEDSRLAYLLVREFGDPSISDDDFTTSLLAFSKVFRSDWSLKFGWAVSAEMKKRGLAE
ncbi:MAG: WGR domain-containing protein [Planctomycetes bacterium]|nr:WGR domain-containing protein [Planctomycetota bacterium]